MRGSARFRAKRGSQRTPRELEELAGRDH
jgi:hypothetical protein